MLDTSSRCLQAYLWESCSLVGILLEETCIDPLLIVELSAALWAHETEAAQRVYCKVAKSLVGKVCRMYACDVICQSMIGRISEPSRPRFVNI